MLEVSDIVCESLSEALETMAFMMAMPPEDELPIPGECVLVSMSFAGPTSGKLELLAGTCFIEMMAANVMGIDPDDEDASVQSVDAFKELLNTACGVIIPKLAGSPADVFDVTIPEAKEGLDEAAWEEFVGEHDALVLDVDGEPMACRLSIE